MESRLGSKSMMEFEAKIPKKIGLPYCPATIWPNVGRGVCPSFPKKIGLAYCTFWQEFVSARMPRNVRPAVIT